VKALINTGKINQYDLKILQAVDAVNDIQKKVLVKKIMEHFNNDINGKTFGIWGLSFKPHTDDTRESPAIVIINELLANGAKVKAYDPVAMSESRKILNDQIVYGKDQYDVVIDADAMILVTEWEEFRMPNFPVLTRLMKNKLIFDGRNIYDPDEMEEEGFTYYCIGRKRVG
jgi:UDPglucose 6-dehydrogenase